MGLIINGSLEVMGSKKGRTLYAPTKQVRESRSIERGVRNLVLKEKISQINLTIILIPTPTIFLGFRGEVTKQFFIIRGQISSMKKT
ncbi:MAG: hypothetical protein RLZZ339_3397 [Cyanobacteriota bacterium]|jgi:hypothetical protein